jgi:hypothetical protein
MPHRHSRDPDGRRYRHRPCAKDGRATTAKRAPGEAPGKYSLGDQQISEFFRWLASNTINPDRTVDILDPPISRVLEEKAGMPQQLFADGRGNGYPTGLRQRLEPGSDVDVRRLRIFGQRDKLKADRSKGA